MTGKYHLLILDDHGSVPGELGHVRSFLFMDFFNFWFFNYFYFQGHYCHFFL